MRNVQEVYGDNDNAKQVSYNTASRVHVPTDHEIVEHNMTNHPPVDDSIVEKFESLRRAAKLFSHTIVDVCPVGRETGLALTNAETALMFAVAAVARNQQ